MQIQIFLGVSSLAVNINIIGFKRFIEFIFVLVFTQPL